MLVTLANAKMNIPMFPVCTMPESRAAIQKRYYEKNREKIAQYRDATKEKMRTYHVARYAEKRDVLLAESKARYVVARDVRLANANAYYAANKEKVAKYQAANKTALAESHAAWVAANPDRVRALSAKRRAAKIQRTPTWADHDAIAAVYSEAQRYADLGVDVHVDHYYPLRGKTVSGLHVHNNLRVILKDDNLRKKNKHPEEVEA